MLEKLRESRGWIATMVEKNTDRLIEVGFSRFFENLTYKDSKSPAPWGRDGSIPSSGTRKTLECHVHFPLYGINLFASCRRGSFHEKRRSPLDPSRPA